MTTGVHNYMLPVFTTHRLVKGEGEIVEEIVSRERQKSINKVWCVC